MSKLQDKGFVLMELIIFIIIGAIFLPVSMVAFTKTLSNYSRPDYYIKARFYAEQKINEIRYSSYNSMGDLCTTPVINDKYTIKCNIIAINRDLTLASSQANDAPYKKITVTVAHSGLLSDYIVSTIVTKRPE